MTLESQSVPDLNASSSLSKPERLSEKFGKRFHLRVQRDFDAVYANRLRARDGVMTVCGRSQNLGFSRLGLSVSRKVGKAHLRNLWKRRIREAFRRNRSALPNSFDLVVIPCRLSDVPPYSVIETSFIKLAGKIAKKNKFVADNSSFSEQ